MLNEEAMMNLKRNGSQSSAKDPAEWGDVRLYSPKESFFTKKWRPNEIELVK